MRNVCCKLAVHLPCPPNVIAYDKISHAGFLSPFLHIDQKPKGWREGREHVTYYLWISTNHNTPLANLLHKILVKQGYVSISHVWSVASEAYHDWSGEAEGARLRVNFTLKLLLSQNFCNWPLMRFISFASNIGPVAAVPAGLAPAPLMMSIFTQVDNRRGPKRANLKPSL